MTKRVLRRIRLDKIAAVDAPCQAHATVAIFKNRPADPGDKSPAAIAKRTFAEALAGQLMSERVSDAFYRAFDNQWAFRQAFQTALVDELVEGGDGNTATAAFVEAMKGVAEKAAEAAREIGANATDIELESAVEKAVDNWLEQQERDMIIKTKADLQAAVKNFDPAKTSVADRDAIVKAATDLGFESELPVMGPLAKVAPPADNAALLRKVAVLELTPDSRKHFDGLDEAGQTAFLAKSASDQAAEVIAKNAGDPVVYTCKDGTAIRKSDGAVAAMFAKRMDEQAVLITTLTSEIGSQSIAKRAAEFSHLPNAETIVKAADLMPEAEREPYLAAMRAANKAQSGAFRTYGSTAQIEKGADSVEGRMDVIVKRIAKEQTLDIPHATIAAAADPEYQALYAEMVGQQPHVQNAGQ